MFVAVIAVMRATCPPMTRWAGALVRWALWVGVALLNTGTSASIGFWPRTIRRCGELLKQVEAQTGKNNQY